MNRILAVYDHKMGDPGDHQLLEKTLGLIASGDWETCSDKEWEDVREPGDVIVAMGNDAAKTVLGRKVSITKSAGYVETGPDDTQIVQQLSPKYITTQLKLKGGGSEKAQRLWLDVWEQVASLSEGSIAAAPETLIYRDKEEIIGLLQWLIEDYDGIFAYDYETSGDRLAVRPELNNEFRIVSISVGWSEGKTLFGAAFLFDRPEWADPEIEQVWREAMSCGRCVCHSSQYEHKANLVRFGNTFYTEDTALKLFTLDELADLKLERVMVRCGLTWGNYKREFDAERKDAMYADVDRLLRYGGLDSYATIHCRHWLQKELQEEEMESVALQNERIAVYLARQEVTGWKIDPGTVVEMRTKLGQQARKLKTEFRKLPEVRRVERWAWKNVKSHARKKSPPEFNPKSTPMMARLVEEELGIEPPTKKNTKGEENATFSKTALEPFIERYKVLKAMNEYRSAAAMEVFLTKWDTYVGPTGCVHTQYNQALVITGRLSSANPPLQNIPKLSEIRKVFVSRFGDTGWLASADYIQQEPRLMAGWSQDRAMIEAILGGLDLHRFVGAQVHDMEYEDVAKDSKEREIGKRMNLGNAYGQTEYGLSAKTGISIERARLLIEKQNEKFPEFADWKLQKHQEAFQLGYVTDLFGARRHLPGARSDNKWERARALRQAGNYPIQGSAYRFTQIAAGVLIELIDEVCPGMAHLIGQVHDSLVVDFHDDVKHIIPGLIYEAMTIHNHMPYWEWTGMPMDVDAKIGRNLFNTKEIKFVKQAA